MSKNKLYTVFISHRWTDGNLVSRQLARFLEADGYKTWLDHFRITAGHQIHDRISHGLDQSDCVVILLTPDALESAEIREEVIRADERRLPIIVLQHTSVIKLSPLLEKFKSQGARFIDFNQADQLDDDAMQAVLEQLETITGTHGFKDLSEANRLIYSIADTLQRSVGEQTYKADMISELLSSLEKELDGFLKGKYEANIGSDRNYLIRATALFEQRLTAVYAVSLSSISKFWKADLPDLGTRYIRAQPEATIRLFVFADRQEADDYRTILRDHYDRYGETGAVLICSHATYNEIAKLIVTHPELTARVLQEDFALLNFEEQGTSTFEVVLSKTHVRFREISEMLYGALNHQRIKLLLDSYKRGLGDGEVPGVTRLERRHVRDDKKHWNALLDATFPEPTPDVYHFVFINPPEQTEEKLAGWLSELKYELSKKLPLGVRPDWMWIGRRQDATDNKQSRPEAWDESRRYVLAVHLASVQQLKDYYQTDLYARLLAAYYSRFDVYPTEWVRYIEDPKFLPEKRSAVFSGVEAIISEFMLQRDFRRLGRKTPSIGRDDGEDESGISARELGDTANSNVTQKLTVLMSRSWHYHQNLKNDIMIDIRNEIGDSIRLIERSPGGAISADLATAQLLLVFQSKTSLEDEEVHEELVRADEQGILIVPVIDLHEPAPRVPAFLSDTSHIRFTGQMELVDFLFRLTRELKKIASSDNQPVLKIVERNRKLLHLAQDLRDLGHKEPFKAAVIRDVLDDARREIVDILSTDYSIDIGLGYSFLQRATKLFQEAEAVYTISYDRVSEFWMVKYLQTAVEDYIKKQKENTVRLFVFQDASTMHQYRDMLELNWKRYGTKGAVLLCSEASYKERFLREVRRDASQQAKLEKVDFGVLMFKVQGDDGTESEATITATLARTSLTFEEKSPLVDAKKVMSILQEAKATEYHSQFGIVRADASLFDPSNLNAWRECVSKLFNEPDRSIMHLAFLSTTASEASEAYQTLAALDDSMEGKRDIWLGQPHEDHAVGMPSYPRPNTETEAGAEFVFMARLHDADHLKAFYDRVWNEARAVDVYKALDTSVQALFRVLETLEVDDPTRTKLQDAILNIARRSVRVADYESVETFEAILGPDGSDRAAPNENDAAR